MIVIVHPFSASNINMRALILTTLSLGVIFGLTWKAAATDDNASLRRRLADPEYNGEGGGFFRSIWALMTGGDTNWKEGDDHNINDLGAFVYEMGITSKFLGLRWVMRQNTPDD